jgi:hypothetical protein
LLYYSFLPSFLPSLCWIAVNAASKNSPQTSNRPQNSDKITCMTSSLLLLLLFPPNSSSLSDRKQQRYQFFQNIYRQNRTLCSRIRIKFPIPISSPWTPEDAAQRRREHRGDFVRATTASSFWTFPEAAAAAEKTTIPSRHNVLEFGTLLLIPESSEVSTGIDHHSFTRWTRRRQFQVATSSRTTFSKSELLRLFPESSDLLFSAGIDH